MKSSSPTKAGATRAIVIHPYLKQKKAGLRRPEGKLAEAVGLAEAIALDVVHAALVPLSTLRPATLIGTGKVEEIKAIASGEHIEVAIVDGHLSPVQQQNLEKAWNCKVIDRTALILEIFGERARTGEGKLQVELASLEYQKGRLVRSWTHLERQRGGFGFLGGPGETQIEADRRMIRDSIAKIKRELETVTRTRELHRKVRRDTPYPVVALVGYTNAGKSTLFNRLTNAGVLAEDMLFATLDPTLRTFALPSGFNIMLSDTVGFVSDLPTELIAAFRATLEEVREADLILHVRDIAHPETLAQKHDVEEVLTSLLGKEESWRDRMIDVHNKIDLLQGEGLPSAGHPVSALTGEGIDALLAFIDETVAAKLYSLFSYRLPVQDGRAMAWLHEHGSIASQQQEEEEIRVSVRLSSENASRFTRLMGYVAEDKPRHSQLPNTA